MEAPIFADSEPPPGGAFISDFAFLHFTAETTMLTVELESTPSNLRTFAAYKKTCHAHHQSFPRVSAYVYSPSKREVGQMRLPASVFRDATRRVCEFVLFSEHDGEIELSTNTFVKYSTKTDDEKDVNHMMGTVHNKHDERHHKDGLVVRVASVSVTRDPEEHEEGCAHKPALNIMLIEWVKTQNHKNFAIRVGVGRIKPSAWNEVTAVEKTIILG